MLPALFLYVSLVNDVRSLISRNDLAAAERAARVYQAQSGQTPELAAALSWLARGSLDSRRLDQAESYAAETRRVADLLLQTRKLDADRYLPIAVGASIEVHAQVLAARGERPEALDFLRRQLALFGPTSLHERIQKNLNLLNLEGKPAPPLEITEWLGSKPVPLSTLTGHPVLLFFWAHWCGDCKSEVPALASLQRTYASQGLVLVAPTKQYGYVARGEGATPPVEKKYIEEVWQSYYAPLGNLPVPLSATNFLTYGSSTTPTIVLIDRAGIVRLYHPGAMPESDLSARIQAILKK